MPGSYAFQIPTGRGFMLTLGRVSASKPSGWVNPNSTLTYTVTVKTVPNKFGIKVLGWSVKLRTKGSLSASPSVASLSSGGGTARFTLHVGSPRCGDMKSVLCEVGEVVTCRYYVPREAVPLVGIPEGEHKYTYAPAMALFNIKPGGRVKITGVSAPTTIVVRGNVKSERVFVKVRNESQWRNTGAVVNVEVAEGKDLVKYVGGCRIGLIPCGEERSCYANVVFHRGRGTVRLVFRAKPHNVGIPHAISGDEASVTIHVEPYVEKPPTKPGRPPQKPAYDYPKPRILQLRQSDSRVTVVLENVGAEGYVWVKLTTLDGRELSSKRLWMGSFEKRGTSLGFTLPAGEHTLQVQAGHWVEA